MTLSLELLVASSEGIILNSSEFFSDSISLSSKELESLVSSNDKLVSSSVLTWVNSSDEVLVNCSEDTFVDSSKEMLEKSSESILVNLVEGKELSFSDGILLVSSWRILVVSTIGILLDSSSRVFVDWTKEVSLASNDSILVVSIFVNIEDSSSVDIIVVWSVEPKISGNVGSSGEISYISLMFVYNLIVRFCPKVLLPLSNHK